MEGKLTSVFNIMCDYSSYEIRGISIEGLKGVAATVGPQANSCFKMGY